ncbi:hypothetical protein D7X87_05080 [bacterium D16-54]|nr:hypothetical protein D7X87_05080 [bacterium D16-54]RKJ16131.1 hypothetical protein D7X65_05075 [bacterium D16-56]
MGRIQSNIFSSLYQSFKSREALEDIYPSLVGHAFYDFNCTDVFLFWVLHIRFIVLFLCFSISIT